jgi:hypothetical protein
VKPFTCSSSNCIHTPPLQAPAATFKELMRSENEKKVDYKNLPAPSPDSFYGFWGGSPPKMVVFKVGERIRPIFRGPGLVYGIEFHPTIEHLHKEVASDIGSSPSLYDLYLVRNPGESNRNNPMGGMGFGEVTEVQMFPPNTTLVELYAFVLKLPFYQGIYGIDDEGNDVGPSVCKNKDMVFFLLAKKGVKEGFVVVDS